jgi:hypothetical protein
MNFRKKVTLMTYDCEHRILDPRFGLLHPKLVRHHVRYRAWVLYFFNAELANPHAAPRPQRRTGRFCPEMAGATDASTIDKSCFLRMTVPVKRAKGPK